RLIDSRHDLFSISINLSIFIKFYFLYFLSGTKGFAVCAPAFPESVAQELLAQIFIYFCDYVMKNPFYELGMPARCKQFDDRVQQLLGKYK
ncbi:Trafficking protein particle complex subunit 4, partial [Perkinsus olseni]